jgi:hypothetical protein
VISCTCHFKHRMYRSRVRLRIIIMISLPTRLGLRIRVIGLRSGLHLSAEHVPIRFVGLGASLLPRPIRDTDIVRFISVRVVFPQHVRHHQSGPPGERDAFAEFFLDEPLGENKVPSHRSVLHKGIDGIIVISTPYAAVSSVLIVVIKDSCIPEARIRSRLNYHRVASTTSRRSADPRLTSSVAG